MELTAEMYFIGMIISAIMMIILAPIVLELYLNRKFPSITKLSDNLTQFVNADGSTEQLSTAVDSMVHIGELASNANAILASSEMMESLMTDLASRVMHSFKMSMMGTASGDVKKIAKAERLVTEAVIEGVKQYSPWINIALKATGLDEELKEDPEMFGLIMQVLTKNDGLMGMLQGMGGIEGMTAGQEQDVVREATTALNSGRGIDF